MTTPWELIAARPGGTVASLAIAASGGVATVYAATAAGLRRSQNGGRTWTAVGSGAIPPPLEVVALSPEHARDRTVFAGTGGGLYRSTDDGSGWQLVLFGSRVLAVALSPRYGVDGLLFVGTETDGILRSEDGGRSWASANPGLLDLLVLALALSPMFEADRTGLAATSSGLYRTRNGGKSWRAVELPLDDPAVQCLALSPDFPDDRLALAGTEADGLFRSVDGGASWELVRGLTARSVTALAFSRRDRDTRTLAAATADGVALSRDGGESWRMTDGQVGPALSLAFVADPDGEVLLAGLPRHGIARLDRDGTWSMAGEGLHANLLVGLALSPAFSRDRTVFTAGLEDGVAVSEDGGASWAPRNTGLPATAFGLALSPRYADDQTLYAATTEGLYRGRDAAATWQRVDDSPALAVVTAAVAGDGPIPVLAALPDGQLLASDDGEGWRPLRPPFEGGDVISVGLSPDYARDRSMFVGVARQSAVGDPANATSAVSLELWRSTDGGIRWERWLVAHGSSALPLAIPPSYPIDGTIFVGVGGRVLRPRRGAWQRSTAERRPIWEGVDIPDAPTVTALATSPAYRDDTTLFAATSTGLYVSRDGGAAFTPWSEGLAPNPIVALAVSPEDAHDRRVYALGLGGTIWRRTDR